MKELNECKGIALTSLILTIFIIIILITMAVLFALQEMKDETAKKELGELGEINQAVQERRELYIKEKDSSVLAGTEIKLEEAEELANNAGVSLKSISDSYNQKEDAYYKLEPEDLENLGVDKSQNTYVVNYTTGEVLNITKQKTIEGDLLYYYPENETNKDNTN